MGAQHMGASQGDWHFQPAYRLLQALDRGKTSSAELVDYFQARAQAHNPALNAIVDQDFGAAKAQAEAADAARKRGESWGPLHGLPMTIKDALEVAGMKAVGGAPQFAGHRPARHAEAVQRIVNAGAIIFGKTNVPFLSGDLQTYNEVYGTTNNPWDLSRGPGGSSGGAAAALAGGLTPLELGSDIGGSIRTPAHLCGVFGHKPTFGIVPKRGHIPPEPGALGEGDLSVVGPLGLSAQDLALLLGIVAGPNEAQAKGFTLNLPRPRATSPKGLRVATWFEDPFCDIDKESTALFTEAAKALEADGAIIDWEARPDFTLAEITEAYLMLLHANVASRMPPHVKERWEKLKAEGDPADKSHAMLQARGGTLSYADWLIWHEKREQLRAKWAEFFTRYDVVLAPVLMRPAFAHDHTSNWHARTLEVNGKSRPYMDVLIWAGPAVLCHLPASVAPVGLTQKGLPVGIQIIGPHLEDYTTIAVAGMLEQALGGFKPPKGF